MPSALTAAHAVTAAHAPAAVPPPTAAHASTAVEKRHARPLWTWMRALGGVCLLAFVAWQVGTGPFLDGVRLIDRWALGAALGIGFLTTVCCAWRWRMVAAGLGVRLPLRQAVAAYYRAQFLNTTLPGGVIGDVHRALRHGVDLGNVGLGVRAVVLERLGSTTVQIGIGVIALLVFPSPVQSHMPMVAIVGATAALGLVLTAGMLARAGKSWLMRALRKAVADIRDGLFSRRTWAGVVLTSVVVLAGQLAIFLLAARTAGATAPLTLLLPLTLFALLAMVLPMNFAGWGPREGAAAWAFGAAGLTATQGVTTAVTYGVLAFAASLPGAGILLTHFLIRVPETKCPATGNADSHG